MRIIAFAPACFLATILSVPALAQEMDGWSGEGTLSGSFTSGNTQTTDIGAGLAGERRLDPWTIKAEAFVDFGKNDGVQSRNRWGVSGQLDRDLNERSYVYGRGSFEKDKFSGFNSRLFVGGGAGYRILMGDMTTWNIEGGPGYRRDEIALTGTIANNFSARIASTFAHEFNESVTFSNDTEWVYSDTSSQLVNIAALTAQLTDVLSARASFEVRNESDPLPGRKATDTITRFSLVYGF